ncbi:pentatricopeptide repeat-containing protein At5g66520-like [Macadamia integrifolia]|uniref:pentatricopeptide repeat-containing protein At5g66520-like n=1 Tax=Macadamia integrifolia TaxID=60698 RepID=UPI001C533EA1|nr:pentatricopeptide repeat-containing protein At5g66520-like [Macadamia integrifolia]
MQVTKQLQAHIIVAGHQLQQEQYLQKLITFFAISNSSSLHHACLIFSNILTPSSFLYNIMIRAYAASSDPRQALNLYNQMLVEGTPPDNYTFPFLLKACSILPHLSKGKETHCQILKHGLHSDIFIQNALIHLYGCNGKIELAHRAFQEMGFDRDIVSWTTLVHCLANFDSIESARRLFDKMPTRSVVSYSALISGYVRVGRYKEALELFRDSQMAAMEPNDCTIMGVLCACANLGALDLGRWIHSYISQRKGTIMDTQKNTALIDMYFKCGSIENALHVFLGTKEKLVGEWTAMISGMAMHGLGHKSIELFEEMLSSGVKPSAVTFVALLSGCTHSGLVDKGLEYFGRMKEEFGIEPTIEHFGCVVDLLSRAGQIERALQFIREMPMEANSAIWGALLNACRVYKNVEIAELAGEWLVNEQPWNRALYVALMSLYREAGRRECVKKVKQEMEKAGCRKYPGCSLVEVNGICYEFVVGDKSLPYVSELCYNLGQLVMEVEDDSNNDDNWIIAHYTG